jgi:hypothetical protein
MERINLGKGKWPDDFLDALKAPSSSPPFRCHSEARCRPGRLCACTSSSVLVRASVSIRALLLPPRDSVESLSLSSSFPSAEYRIRLLLQPPPLQRAGRRTVRSIALTRLYLHRKTAPVTSRVEPGSFFSRSWTKPWPSRIAQEQHAQREGAGRMCRGEAVLKMVVVVEARATHLCPSRSRAPCLASLPARSIRHPVLQPVPIAVAPGRPLERAGSTSSANSPSLIPRGRFQSEVDGSSSRRRPRPNSYDEFGAKPRRSRFESMVNLGVASGEQASASDLMARDATEGSMSRQTLVVREEGKAPTHFVSDLVHHLRGRYGRLIGDFF